MGQDFLRRACAYHWSPLKSIGDEVSRFGTDLRFILIRSAPLKTIRMELTEFVPRKGLQKTPVNHSDQ